MKKSVENLEDNLEEVFQKWSKNGKKRIRDKKNRGHVQEAQHPFDRSSIKKELRK